MEWVCIAFALFYGSPEMAGNSTAHDESHI